MNREQREEINTPLRSGTDIAKRFLAWQKSAHRSVSLSQVKSFLRHLNPTASNEFLLAASRQMYAEMARLIDEDWLKSDEAKTIMRCAREDLYNKAGI